MEQTPENKQEAIGERLADFRRKKKLKQIFVAEQLGVDPSTVGRIEKGAIGCSAERLADFADLYEVTADQILGRIS